MLPGYMRMQTWCSVKGSVATQDTMTCHVAIAHLQITDKADPGLYW